MKLLLPILVLCITSFSFGADDDCTIGCKITDSIGYYVFPSGRKTTLSQEEGRIFFTRADEEDGNIIHNFVDKIYHFCAKQKLEDLQIAEKLLKYIEEEYIEQPDIETNESDALDYCTGLVCIGQGYLKNPNTHEKALSYFLKSFHLYNFTGAAYRIAALRCYHEPQAALYYILKAQAAGGQYYQSTDDILARLIRLENKEESLKAVQKILEFEKDPENY